MKIKKLLFKRKINGLVVIVGLILLLLASMTTDCLAQEGEVQEIHLSAYYPQALAAYEILRTKYILDRHDPVVVASDDGWKTVAPTYIVDPSGTSIFRNLILTGPLRNHRTNGAFVNDGDMHVGGAIYGLEADSNGLIYYIDLNHDTDVGDPTHRHAAAIHSMHVEGRITVGEFATDGTDGKTVFGDLAETIYAIDCEDTDVVIISNSEDLAVVKSVKKFDARVAGIVSEDPKLCMGDHPKGKPVALAGIVKCKATSENGAIKRGDLLVTASEPGHAMRADAQDVRPGMLLGNALTELTENKGIIFVLVN